MSWNLSTHAPKSGVRAALNAQVDELVERQGAGIEGELRDQLGAAINAAEAMASAVGPEDGVVIVSLSGHANAGHGSAEGFAEETLTVSVTRTLAAVEQETGKGADVEAEASGE